MALINCPECGHKISDQAAMCIYCGFPLQNVQRGQVKIHFKLHPKLYKMREIRIRKAKQETVIWSGKPGDTAIFDIYQPTYIEVDYWGDDDYRNLTLYHYHYLSEKPSYLVRAGEMYVASKKTSTTRYYTDVDGYSNEVVTSTIELTLQPKD